MSNLTRYDIGGYDCGQTCIACGMEVSAEGEYVKFDDIKELLNSSHNSAMDAITELVEEFIINNKCDEFDAKLLRCFARSVR